MEAPRGRFSTRLYLIALAAALILPGLAFTGVLLWQYAGIEQARYEQQARNDARQQANAIDRDLAGLQATLQALATSGRLRTRDFSGFHAQALEVRSYLGTEFEVRQPDGQQLVNTRVPYGTTLPVTPLAIDKEIITTRQASVSNVSLPGTARTPLFAAIVPVIENGEVVFLLSASASTERIADLIKDQLPPPWVIAVGDRNGRYVARSDRHAEFSGTMGRADFLSLAQGESGFFISKSVDANDILAGYAHTRFGNWLVAVSIEKDVVEAPLRRVVMLFILLGAVALITSVILALWLWTFVSKPIAALANSGPMLARGEIFPEISTSIAEIGILSRVISGASVALEERAEARDVAERSLKELAESLEEKVTERTRALESANVEIVAEMRRREEAEQQVRQLQKMEAIGQLTGGIAHDFNNMLAVIMSALNLVERKLARGDSDVRKYLDAAIEGANRAAVLTSRLLAFSRQQALAPKAIDVNKLILGMSELVHRTLGASIRIETIPARDLWRIHADPSQLENAILNLAVNGRDAMPEGGRLTIETANCRLDDAFAASHAVDAGHYAMIAVSDTGSGMSEDVVARAFEPFFSTKGAGKGTGLGLSQVYGFVKQSNGHVKIESAVGQGTTVRIYLPRFFGTEVADTETLDLAALKLGRAEETVLIVEDDDRVRHLTVEALAELGYTVREANGAAEALKVLDGNLDIALLFTDIVMPDVDGRRLADEALRRRPSLKVLFTTGFTRNAVVHNGVLDEGVNFLQKPYTLEQLATMIRGVLDGSSPP